MIRTVLVTYWVRTCHVSTTAQLRQYTPRAWFAFISFRFLSIELLLGLKELLFCFQLNILGTKHIAVTCFRHTISILFLIIQWNRFFNIEMQRKYCKRRV